MPDFRDARWSCRLLAVLLTLVCVGPAAAQEDDPFEAAEQAFMATGDPEAQLAVVRGFLAEYPDHSNVAEVAEAGADILIRTRDDRAGAISLLERQLEVTTDPELRQALRMVLLQAFAHPDYAAAMEKLAAEHFDPVAMGFGAQLELMKAAEAAEAWTLVESAVAAASAKATPEAFVAEHGAGDYSIAHLRERGDNRRGQVLTHLGWLQVQQGELQAALASFAQAQPLLAAGFIGVPDNELFLFWGQALIKAGQADEGVQKLALAEAFGADHEAGELARRHYAALDRRESFDDYVWGLRRAHGPVMEPFEATDYTGTVRSFHELKGRKATLVAFWFPT